ncbi:amphiregulin [Rhinatrema bivittatum]|uniref:amphiregulin n=1 Tax=Rhinatrema bivittatum TaxID=194408 RepID=UPI001125F194|nr:amphiregulin [Rhinatrema bivittatum]
MEPRLLLLLLLAFLGSHRRVFGSAVGVTASERNVSLSEDHSLQGTEVTVTREDEESEDEENEDELPVSGFTEEETEDELPVSGLTEEDLFRVEPVVKPKNTEKDGEKKNTEKKKNRAGKGKGNKKNKKKENPCETTHKGFCFHGECRYLEDLQKVACICQLHYFGERCSEMSMKTQTKGDLSDTSMTALVVVAVLLSAISFIAIIIIIVIHTHKKYSRGYEGEVEEKKRLGQENGSGDLDV